MPSHPTEPDVAERLYLLIVGIARSGTTLLANLLNGHPGITVWSDYCGWPVTLADEVGRIDGPLTPELLAGRELDLWGYAASEGSPSAARRARIYQRAVMRAVWRQAGGLRRALRGRLRGRRPEGT